jgi:hypothetical protein
MTQQGPFDSQKGASFIQEEGQRCVILQAAYCFSAADLDIRSMCIINLKEEGG